MQHPKHRAQQDDFWTDVFDSEVRAKVHEAEGENARVSVR
jgi:hypothetical protein